MLTLKSAPSHKFSLAVLLASEVNPEWLIGRIEDGKLIENVIECTIDNNSALIRIIDQWKFKVKELTLANAILNLGLGLSSEMVKQVLYKKYKGLTAETEIRLLIYELIELGNGPEN